jgi:Uma2 family endonuclease
MTAPIAFGDIEEDQHVILRGMSWEDFESILAIRGDRPGVRMYYLDGEIELMSPARTHEDRKKTLARLLEVWAVESNVEINGFGSWTLKQQRRKAGAEPDECYILGDATHRDAPELVIEVEWSRTLGLEKREIYRRLGVRELWTLRADGQLVIRVLHDNDWVESERSDLLPELDVRWMLSFLAIESQGKAVLAFRDALRAR